jgi:hypothetical protein
MGTESQSLTSVITVSSGSQGKGAGEMKCKVCSKKVNGQDKICSECWDKPFKITSVCRADLQDYFSEEEIAGLEDGDMARIARKMAEAYCDQVFWIHLEMTGEYVLEDA